LELELEEDAVTTVYRFDPERDRPAIERLWRAYARESADRIRVEAGVELDPESVVGRDLEGIADLLPPSGQLLLADIDGVPVGCGSLRRLGGRELELKRLFVDAAARGRGVGRALVEALLKEAAAAGAELVRLDAGWYAREALALYRSLGFVETPPYPESEIPPEHHARWTFMARQPGGPLPPPLPTP